VRVQYCRYLFTASSDEGDPDAQPQPLVFAQRRNIYHHIGVEVTISIVLLFTIYFPDSAISLLRFLRLCSVLYLQYFSPTTPHEPHPLLVHDSTVLYCKSLNLTRPLLNLPSSSPCRPILLPSLAIAMYIQYVLYVLASYLCIRQNEASKLENAGRETTLQYRSTKSLKCPNCCDHVKGHLKRWPGGKS
jgi:hypothetical protein